MRTSRGGETQGRTFYTDKRRLGRQLVDEVPAGLEGRAGRPAIFETGFDMGFLSGEGAKVSKGAVAYRAARKIATAERQERSALAQSRRKKRQSDDGKSD